MKRSGIRTSLGYLLTEADRRLARVVAEPLAAAELTVEEWRVLGALRDGHGHSMGELAEISLLNGPTLSKLTDRLASRALVYRRQARDDRRRVAVYLAEPGRELVDRLQPAVDAALSAALDGLGATRAKRLAAGLEALVDALAATDDHHRVQPS